MSMRVISGSARGLSLKRVPGDGTRPIMDRVKEALFNILGDNIRDGAFLDLYAGTGSVGIEALSRGAERAVFVENAKAAITTIEENLKSTRLAEWGEIVRRDVRDYLRQPNPEPFEFVYIAPPQYKNQWHDTLMLLDKNPDHVAPDGIVVVQIDPVEKHDITLENFVPYDERRYGKTLIWFFERPGE
jgi:16S rRNA (guanine966-N2)-methyltransferase